MRPNKLSSILVMGLALAVCLALVAGPAAAADQIRWKGQSCFGINSPLGKHTIVLWKDLVEQMSGGQMQITLHDAGEIVPSSKVYDAVKDGLLDFGLNTPAYQKGK